MNNLPSFPGANGSGGPLPQPGQSLDSLPSPPTASRMPTDRNGAMPMPVAGPQRGFGSTQGDMGPAGMPRSPPKNKNTQHVPCKFFLQGQCQAGRMCPFSHDVESSTRPAPCKYFAKGGCKFGRKCALLHITPDGTVVNRTQQYSGGPTGSVAPPFPGAHAPPAAYPQPPPPGLLSMQAQGLVPRPNGEMHQDLDSYQYPSRNGYDETSIDMTYTSASPNYGSPPQDNRFAGSPPGAGQGLSVLDAPLPNSFDSNGISMAAAHHGPVSSSMPPRFGMESPPSSLPRKSQLGNTALRDLHSSAFGDRGISGVLAGSSPPSGLDEPLTFPKRSVHLQAPISASLGTKLPTQSFEYSDDEEGGTDREEDLLPASLRELIPEGRMRSSSRRNDEENTPANFLAAQRRTISSHGTPNDSKVGSPHSSSPSRYNSIFARNPSGRSEIESHVGSPLRNFDLPFIAASSRPTSGDLSPTVSSPPRQASMSMLTQELQRTKLDAARSQAAAAVGMTRSVSNGSTGRSSFERAMSSNNVGRERIDEEVDLFDMDEVGDPSRTAPRTIPNGGHKNSTAWSNKPFSSPPGESAFGAIGGHRTNK